MKQWILALGAVAMTAPMALADEALIAEGEKQFKRCATCHMIETPEGEKIGGFKGRVGPNLYGVPGRLAGSNEDYGKKYGKGLIEAGEQGLTWDEESFTAYIADPRGYIKEVLGKSAQAKMAAQRGVDGAAVWAYLVSVSPAVEAAEDAPAESATN